MGLARPLGHGGIWEGWGTMRETQCSLTKAVTRAHEIQMPRRELRPQAPGRRDGDRVGSLVFALRGSPVS